jgi:hypothetical protein
MQLSVLVLLVFVGVALCQPTPPSQPNLFPFLNDGIETVELNDMSFVNEISIQTYSATNMTFYVYGDSRIRTIYPGPNFYVGSTPNENWHLPFIDFHTFQNGSDVWGIGPINALYARNRTAYSGFQFEIAIITTKAIPDNPRGRIFVEQPLGFEGTFYSVRVVGFDIDNVIGYFCGFFPVWNNSSPTPALNFGVRRAHFNTSLFDGSQSWNTSNDAWYFNWRIDDAVIFPNAQLVTYNADFKPFLLHARNVSSNAPPNSTWLVVVDPYSNFATLVMANFNQSVPLNVTGYSYVPVFGNFQFGRIVSAVIWSDLLFVGVSVDGQGTGWIDILNLSNLTRRANAIVLPANVSDPRALVLDYFSPTPTLYVGPNGGDNLLRIDINKLAITGYQALPFYLHRTWRGMATHEHVYFVTNEQHSKVYRVNKADFCPATCMEFGYCYRGRCVCNQNMVQNGNTCEWKQVVVEKNIAHKDEAGEIVLGIFFAIATVAAVAGWYMVWKNRRGYQAVA